MRGTGQIDCACVLFKDFLPGECYNYTNRYVGIVVGNLQTASEKVFGFPPQKCGILLEPTGWARQAVSFLVERRVWRDVLLWWL